MKPWVTGPKELLEHAVKHLSAGAPFDCRIAFISIDNAVEVAIKTFLGLPKRARGTAGPSRRELKQASQSFPDLLDLLEKHAADKIQGFGLEDVEWYHRLRNDLYHNGNGITVEPEKVDGYLQIASVLFEGLFGEKIAEAASPSENSLGEFVLLWAKLEKRARKLSIEVLSKQKSLKDPLTNIIDALVAKGSVSGDFRSRLERIARVRNEVVHGMSVPDHAKIRELAAELRALINEIPRASEDDA